MADITVSVGVSLAWWLRPYLVWVLLFTHVTGLKPNQTRFDRMVRSGIRVEIHRRPGQPADGIPA